VDAPALYWIPLLPLLGAATNLLFGKLLFGIFNVKIPRGFVYFVAISSVLAAFGVVLANVLGPLMQDAHAWHAAGADMGTRLDAAISQKIYTWIEIGDFKVDMTFTLDALSAVMCLVITSVGSLIHIYSTGYMSHDDRYPAFFGYLNLFTGSMLILVLGNSLPVMFIGWEGVGLCSYLLIGFWYTKDANAYAGRKAFVVNRIGDFAFLLGMFLLYWATGSVDFPGLNDPGNAGVYQEAFIGSERLAMWAGLLLFIGACGKSAQIPLYIWLPDAMAGPTPVSALIHAATMVTAGVYMIARLSFLYAQSTTAMAIVATVGAFTALFAAFIAFAQTDFKKVLAYSTVSQLGFMFVGVGVGAYAAGIAHLVTHAVFKAGLFLTAGSVMHAMADNGDIRIMGGLRKYMPKTFIACTFCWLAICGIFPFAGFWSKDEILAGAFFAHGPAYDGWASWYGYFIYGVTSLAALGTAFYMTRLYLLVFFGECRAPEDIKKHIHEAPPSMWVPVFLLGLGACVVGFIALPHFLHFEHFQLHHWIMPSVADLGLEAHGMGPTLGLMGLASVLAVIGIGAAWSLYSKGPSDKVAAWTAEGGPLHGLYKLSLNKVYVDEFFDWLVVKPFRKISVFLFEFVDRVLIDRVVVSGTAIVVDLAGRALRYFQNGSVQRYLAVFLVGGALVVYFASRPAADFRVKPGTGTTVIFEAAGNEGLGREQASFAWDFDGDGEPDSGKTKPRVSHTFPSPGEYKVSLTFTDGVFGKTKTVTKTIIVHPAAGGPGANDSDGAAPTNDDGAPEGGAE